MHNQSINRWLRNIVTLIILGFLLWYLAGHWHELKVMLKLSPAQLALMYFLSFLSILVGALVDKCLLKALNTDTLLWDLLRLNNAALLLNYAPMKFGTLFRADYLKRHYGLSYTRFATFFLYVILLMTTTAATIGLAVLLAVYGLAERQSQILAGIFGITIAGSLLFLFVPLPVPTGQGQFRTRLRNFLAGRSQIAKDAKTNAATIGLLVIVYLLTAVRLGIIYHGMGQSIHPAGYLVLGALGFVVLFIGLTPGALGIRELVLGFGAAVLGVPLQIGILAAMIDRAITLSYAFAVGGSCAVWLWRKSPTDFKKQQNNGSGRAGNRNGQ